MKLMPQPRGNDKKALPRRWHDTAGANALNASNLVDIHSTANVWLHGKHVVAHSEDLCKNGGWVYAHSPFSVSYEFSLI